MMNKNNWPAASPSVTPEERGLIGDQFLHISAQCGRGGHRGPGRSSQVCPLALSCLAEAETGQSL